MERISYDRSFLLALRLSPLSLVKPISSEEDVILSEPLTPESSSSQEINEDYFSHLQYNNKSSNHKHVITGIFLNNDQKLLHVSEKPWKPGHRDSQKTEKNKCLESAVLYIMNRLTPSNFKKLAEEMMALEIKTFEDLELVVETVFDKVSLETKFVQAYASLCQVMLGLQVDPPPSLARNKATFRTVLVTKCQKTFEADKSVIFEDSEDTKKKIMEEMPEDTPSRAEKIESALYQIKLKQLKFFGNISFIGELFKLGILPEVIIHSCITRLLSAADEESLFSLCKLITTVGKHIDTRKAKVQIDKYFVRISQLANASKSRLKFALKDVLDLRKNKWVPRTEAAGPKTIAELHKEFNEEKSTATSESPKSKPKKLVKTEVREVPLSQNNRLNAKVRKQNIPTDIIKEKEKINVGDELDKENDDSWTQVTSKGKSSKPKNKKDKARDVLQVWSKVSKTRDCPTIPDNAEGSFDVTPKLKEEVFTFKKDVQDKPTEEDFCPPGLVREEQSVETIDFNRFKLSKKQTDDDIILAPGGRSMISSFMGRLSTKTSIKTSDEVDTQNKNTNRFSLLLNETTQECLDDQPQGYSRPVSANQRRPHTHVNTCQMENGKSIKDTLEAEAHRHSILEKPVSVNQMTEVELQNRTQNIIDEYISCKDKKEALLCITELKSQADLTSLVTLTINLILEKTDANRELIGELFNELIKTEIISVESLMKGFSEVLVVAEDIVIDVPKLWTYLAQLLAPMLGHALPWRCIEPLLCPHVSPDNCAVLLAHILKLLQEKSQISVTDIQNNWAASRVQWTKFMPLDRVPCFLDTYGISDIFTSAAYIDKSEDIPVIESKAVVVTASKDAGESIDAGVALADNSVVQSADKTDTELADKTVVEPINVELADKAVVEVANKAVVEVASKAVVEVADKAVVEVADKAVVEVADKAVVEVANKAVVEVAIKAVVEVAEKAVVEVADKVVVEVADKAVVEPIDLVELADKAVVEVTDEDVVEVAGKAFFKSVQTAVADFSDKTVVVDVFEVAQQNIAKSGNRDDFICKQAEAHFNIYKPVGIDCCSNTQESTNAEEIVSESLHLQAGKEVTFIIEDTHLDSKVINTNYHQLDTDDLVIHQSHTIQDTAQNNSSDVTGEAIWRKEMEEDQCGFSVSFMPACRGASPFVVCKVPFIIDIGDESEIDTMQECSSYDGIHQNDLQCNDCKITAVAVESDNNRCDREAKQISLNVCQTEPANKESFPNLQDEGYYETSSNEEFSEDAVQAQWSTVYLDGSSKQYLECSEEEISSFPPRNDRYFWGSKLYTHKDHRRYLQQLQLEKASSVLSAEAPSFYPGKLSAPLSERNWENTEQCLFSTFNKQQCSTNVPRVCQDDVFSVSHEVHIENEFLASKLVREESLIDSFLQHPHNTFSVGDEKHLEDPTCIENSTAADASGPDSYRVAVGQVNPMSLFFSEPQAGDVSQSNADLISFLVMCQQAASVVETMLRNKSTNQEIVQFIQNGIMGTSVHGAVMPIFMTALAYSSMNDDQGKIVAERKEIISYLLRNDQSREIEAVQILYIVLCHLNYPQGISALLDDLYNEGLVSLSSLQTLFHFIQNARMTSDSSS